jgi:hypothetical protein
MNRMKRLSAQLAVVGVILGIAIVLVLCELGILP